MRAFFKSLKVADRVLIGLTLAFVCSSLYCSLYGLSENWLFCTLLFLGVYAAIIVFFVVPIILVDFICWLINPKRFGNFFFNRDGSLVTVTGVAISIGLMVLQLAVLGWNMPMRAGFFLAKSRLDSIAALDNPETAIGEWAGPWKIHGAKKTADGKVYIRVTDDNIAMGEFIGFSFKGYTEKASDSPFGEAIYDRVKSDPDWSIMYVNRD